MTMWGIHNTAIPADELVREGFISIGWDHIGDLRQIGDDQERMKDVVGEGYPGAKAGAIPVWAACLRRFAFTAREHDIVIAPNKTASTLNFGRLVGDYWWEQEAPMHRHRRSVEWLRTDVPRSVFPQPALFEIGSAVTMFEVKKNRSVFEGFLRTDRDVPEVVVAAREPTIQPVDDAARGDQPVEDEPSAARIEQYTRDLVLKTLLSMEPVEFEHFTAALLRATGYQARVTQLSGDGGVDVIAHRDLLGLQGIIKVQCKRSASTQGIAEVNQLTGTLAAEEKGLFVCLGAYSTSARSVERQRHDLRLLGAEDVIDMTLSHYPQLPPEWRARIPLRLVYVVDRDAEGY